MGDFRIQTPQRAGSLMSRDRPASTSKKQERQGTPTNLGKALYEETYYISSVRDNYLTLISDNMEILELPLGLIQDEVKVGHPIKLRLEYDHKRQQQDETKFKTLQKNLYR